MRHLLIQTCASILLGLMILVPTDIYRMGLDHLFGSGDVVTWVLECELDTEEEKESKEKDSKEKEKNKLIQPLFGALQGDAAEVWMGDHNAFGSSAPLAHYLDVWTPPPERS